MTDMKSLWRRLMGGIGRGYQDGYRAGREIRQLENLLKEHCELAKLETGDYLVVFDSHAVSKETMAKAGGYLGSKFGVRSILVQAHGSDAVRMYRIEPNVLRETSEK